MAVKIGSNIESQKGVRQLSRATDALSSVNERLSSGQRINHASDDAAGLAIASSLNAKARVYTVAQRNVSDTISAVSIASDAVSALTEITTRQKELAEQSANGTYSTKQRTALDKESRELTNEYNRIVSTTQFNGIKLLDNPWDTLSTQLGIGDQASIGFKFADELSTKLTPGGYFLLDGVTDYYVWFTIDGQGSDPAPLDPSQGARVDLTSKAVGGLTLTTDTFDFFPSSSDPAFSFYVNTPTFKGQFWFNVDGGTADPGDPDHRGYQRYAININSADDIVTSLNAAATAISSVAGPDVTVTTGGAYPSLFIQGFGTTGSISGAVSSLASTSSNLLYFKEAYLENSGLTGNAVAAAVAKAIRSVPANEAGFPFSIDPQSHDTDLYITNALAGTITSNGDVTSGIVRADILSKGFSSKNKYSSTFVGQGVTAFDADHDGKLDLVSLGSSNTYAVRYNLGDGTFSNEEAYAPSFILSPASSALASSFQTDVNGDGRADNINVTYNGGTGAGKFTVSLQQSNGSYALPTSYATIDESTSGGAFDLNGDGRPDIVTAGSFGRIGVSLNNGAGTFSSVATYNMFISGGLMRAVDLNGDNRLELVNFGVDGVSSSFSVLLNQGNGTFGPAAVYEAHDLMNGAPSEFDMADINGDGSLDLIGLTSGAQITTYLNDGHGMFNPSTGTSATQRLVFGDARGMTQINQIDLTTQFLAKKAMSVLDARLERLGKQQGAFGAVQSRLQTASRVLSTTTLNYRTAESRIMDTDIAQDAAEQTRLTIIQRAAASVLAQANLQPEIALKLLKN